MPFATKILFLIKVRSPTTTINPNRISVCNESKMISHPIYTRKNFCCLFEAFCAIPNLFALHRLNWISFEQSKINNTIKINNTKKNFPNGNSMKTQSHEMTFSFRKNNKMLEVGSSPWMRIAKTLLYEKLCAISRST